MNVISNLYKKLRYIQDEASAINPDKLFSRNIWSTNSVACNNFAVILMTVLFYFQLDVLVPYCMLLSDVSRLNLDVRFASFGHFVK